MFSQLPPGQITGIAGVPHGEGQPAAEAHVGWPIGVVRRADGDLIVADWHANRLWRIDGDGILRAFAGDGVPGDRGDGGLASEARLRGPHSLVLDRHGNIFTADLANCTIRRVDAGPAPRPGSAASTRSASMGVATCSWPTPPTTRCG